MVTHRAGGGNSCPYIFFNIHKRGILLCIDDNKKAALRATVNISGQPFPPQCGRTNSQGSDGHLLNKGPSLSLTVLFKSY